jgi:hypothetical protein
VLLALTAVIMMVIEARRHAVKFVWLYVALGFATAISVAFPLFLIARELRTGGSDEPHPGPTDTILLAVVANVTAVWTLWVDAGWVRLGGPLTCRW